MDGGTKRNQDACAGEQMKKPTRIVRKPVILIKRIRVVETRNASVMAIVDIVVCQRVCFKEVDFFFIICFFYLSVCFVLKFAKHNWSSYWK